MQEKFEKFVFVFLQLYKIASTAYFLFLHSHDVIIYRPRVCMCFPKCSFFIPKTRWQLPISKSKANGDSRKLPIWTPFWLGITDGELKLPPTTAGCFGHWHHGSPRKGELRRGERLNGKAPVQSVLPWQGDILG